MSKEKKNKATKPEGMQDDLKKPSHPVPDEKIGEDGPPPHEPSINTNVPGPKPLENGKTDEKI